MAALLSTKYRPLLAAATMLGQGKNVFQTEIDTPCEAIDFLNYNVHYAEQIYHEQPSPGGPLFPLPSSSPSSLTNVVIAITIAIRAHRSLWAWSGKGVEPS